VTVILSANTITDVMTQLRKEKRKVVLTHGVYDLLHVGHLNFLKESKKKGDYLFVGVDSDLMATTFKKTSRPVLPQRYRQEQLLGINCVDFVFQVHDPEKRGQDFFYEMYEEMNPHYVTFGKFFGYQKQYKKKQFKIPGVKYNQISHQYDDVGVTTTNIIDKIRKRQRFV